MPSRIALWTRRAAGGSRGPRTFSRECSGIGTPAMASPASELRILAPSHTLPAPSDMRGQGRSPFFISGARFKRKVEASIQHLDIDQIIVESAFS